jgi:hypothetical protein
LEDQGIDGTLIMNLEYICVDEKWINLALGRGQWCALVTTIMSRWVPKSTGNLFTTCATTSFSRQTLHQFRPLLDLRHLTFRASCNELHRIRALLTAQNGCHLRKSPSMVHLRRHGQHTLPVAHLVTKCYDLLRNFYENGKAKTTKYIPLLIVIDFFF